MLIRIDADDAEAQGLLICECGHPSTNHFSFDEKPCAHCSCKKHRQIARVGELLDPERLWRVFLARITDMSDEKTLRSEFIDLLTGGKHVTQSGAQADQGDVGEAPTPASTRVRRPKRVDTSDADSPRKGSRARKSPARGKRGAAGGAKR